MKRAFTLIELLVVIGIIAILAGVLLVTFSTTTESARAAKCLTNMKNLATACQVYGTATGYYPNAGSVNYITIDESRGIRNAQKQFNETKGWISWLSRDVYPVEGGDAPTPNTLGFLGNGNDEDNLYALTNGALWKYISSNRDTYVCPCHVQKSKRVKPLWSYLMSARFKWDSSEGYAYHKSGSGVGYGGLARADRILLFSEIPFRGPGEWFPEGDGGGVENDAILQYRGCKEAPGLSGKSRRDGDETIGGNHPLGNAKHPKAWFAHVAFADAHVEKIKVSNLSTEALKELTTLLCTGKDYTLDSDGKLHELK